VELSHTPINPPRKGHFGEAVFLKNWQELAVRYIEDDSDDMDRTEFDRVFHHYRWNPGQQEATVVASIVVWLGTNCGLAFLRSAQAQTKKSFYVTEAAQTIFLMEWAKENQRLAWVNRGIRTLENCLTKECSETKLVELTGRDYEIAECFVCWLATRPAQKYIAICEAEIDQDNKRRNLADLEKIGLGDSGMATRLRAELAS